MEMQLMALTSSFWVTVLNVGTLFCAFVGVVTVAIWIVIGITAKSLEWINRGYK